MPDLADFETLIARLAAIDFSQTSEQATREMAVNPVIGALGWDTFDPGEVAREYPVRGGKVDYCLRGPMSALALIEVKRTGQELSEHQEQLLGYAFREGAPLAALTDGLVWWLYLPRAGGSWEQRRFYSIDFREQDAARAASAMRRFLSREGVVGGTAQKEAQREFDSQERERRASAIVRATRATAATASSAGAGAYLAPAAVLLVVLETLPGPHKHADTACPNGPPSQGPGSALQPLRQISDQQKQRVVRAHPAHTYSNQQEYSPSCLSRGSEADHVGALRLTRA